MKEFFVLILENSFLQSVLGTLLGVAVGHHLASRFQRKMLKQQLEAEKESQKELQAHIVRATGEMTMILQRELNGISARVFRSTHFKD
jgi:hypothetical protein